MAGGGEREEGWRRRLRQAGREERTDVGKENGEEGRCSRMSVGRGLR